MLLLIANDGSLGPEWQDHALTGDWASYRECHIGVSLIYRLDGKPPHEVIVFVRAGTRADLLE
jgi:mRNA interferase YafQ